MNDHGKMWDNGGDAKLWANGQSAIGFKPNDPGTDQPGETFLLGAIRHNNLPWSFIHASLVPGVGVPPCVSHFQG